MHQKHSKVVFIVRSLFAILLFASIALTPSTTLANDDGGNCEAGFNSVPLNPWLATLIEKLDKLDPTFANTLRAQSSSISVQEALVLLKEQEYVFSDDYTMRWPLKNTLSAQQVSHLLSEFNNDFNIAKLNEPELRQFYANHLRQIYLWFGGIVLKSITQAQLRLINSSLDQFDLIEQKILLQVTETRIGNHWLDRSTNPKTLVSLLSLQNGQDINFKNLIGHIKTKSYDSTKESKLVETAEQQVKNEQSMCCASKPGCRTCPINYGLRN